MRKLLLLLLLASLSVQADDFGTAQWIGAITQKDARIPRGKNFTGAKLKEPAVKAAWAAVDSLSQRSIYLRRDIRLSGQVQRATLYICGLGFYEATLNGQRVGDATMAPHWSDYDKTVFYNVYDVTPHLTSSPSQGNQENLSSPSRGDRGGLLVLLGNGFYNEQGGRYVKMKVAFGPPTLRLRLHIDYADGQKEDIVSDASWQWALSPITFNSIYGGEDYDARLEDNPTWHPAVVQEAPRGTLRRQIAEPVKIMERYKPIAKNRKSTALVFDMGQNLAGFPEITVKGRRGQQLKLTPGETLTDEGLVNQKQSGRPHYYTYTLKGEDTETWHPRFSYYGYRYLQVEGDVEALQQVQSCFIYNAASKTGTFACSNTIFNNAYRLIDRAIRSNWQSVWTDCPHREKLGWLEQDWLNGEGLISNYDCQTMIEETMQQISDAQFPNGALPEIAPNLCIFEGSWAPPFLESPEWGGTFIMLPYNYWRYYGSDRLIRQHFSSMKRYVDYLHERDSCYILNMGLGDWYDYTGGRGGFAQNTSVAFVATAHMLQWTDRLAEMARIVGEQADAEAYAQRARAIGQAIRQHFFHPADGTFDTGSQCAQSIALCLFGSLLTDGERLQVRQRLIDDIHKHGDRLTTGDVGTRYLFQALTADGDTTLNALFYTMLNHEQVPGYGYQIKLGHTTLTEQWDPVQGASMNHFMMGHLNNHLVPRIVGIDVQPHSQLLIHPMPVGDLTWARGSSESAKGPIAAEWRIERGRFLLDVDVPAGLQTTVRLPRSGKLIKLKRAGRHHFEEKAQ